MGKTDNPYVVAQEFLWREELNQGFLDEVAQFIIKNTTPFTFTQSNSIPGTTDPFTGKMSFLFL